jgi:hypothetical protein
MKLSWYVAGRRCKVSLPLNLGFAVQKWERPAPTGAEPQTPAAFLRAWFPPSSTHRQAPRGSHQPDEVPGMGNRHPMRWSSSATTTLEPTSGRTQALTFEGECPDILQPPSLARIRVSAPDRQRGVKEDSHGSKPSELKKTDINRTVGLLPCLIGSGC